MKKVLFFSFVLIIFGSALSSCGSKEERMRSQYMEACADRDFTKARAAIEKMGSEMSEYQLADHYKYVNDKEIYTLLEAGSKDASNRIMFLFNSSDLNQMPDMRDVLEVAVSTGNEYLAGKLIDGGVRYTPMAVHTAAENDMSEIIEKMVRLSPEILSDKVVFNYYIKAAGKDKFRDVLLENISGVDMYAILDMAKNNNMNDVYAIALDLLVDKYCGTTFTKPSTGRYSTGMGERKPPVEHIRYQNAVTKHNEEGLKLIQYALYLKNTGLCNKIISGMQSRNISWKECPGGVMVEEISLDDISKARERMRNIN